jgi:hypothetical protein
VTVPSTVIISPASAKGVSEVFVLNGISWIVSENIPVEPELKSIEPPASCDPATMPENAAKGSGVLVKPGPGVSAHIPSSVSAGTRVDAEFIAASVAVRSGPPTSVVPRSNIQFVPPPDRVPPVATGVAVAKLSIVPLTVIVSTGSA